MQLDVIPGYPIAPDEVRFGPVGPLPLELIEQAQGNVAAAFDFGHEWNVLQISPGFIFGSYNLPAWTAASATKLAITAETVRKGYNSLIEFLGEALADFTFWLNAAQQTGPEFPVAQSIMRRALQYYVDTFRVVGPEIVTIAGQLDLAGKMVEEKIRTTQQAYE